jgi:hypothetical protein
MGEVGPQLLVTQAGRACPVCDHKRHPVLTRDVGPSAIG